LQHKLVDSIGGEAEVIKYLEDKRNTAKGLRIVDWKPRRDSDFSWFRLSAGLLGQVFGARDAETQILNIQQGFAASMLDGLVSVWQPTEK
jgi:protease IV